jgi:hypothetical protein
VVSFLTFVKIEKVLVNVGYNTAVINTLKILSDILKNLIAWAKRCTGFVHPCFEADPEVVTSS